MTVWDFGLHLTDVLQNGCHYWLCPWQIEKWLGYEPGTYFSWGSNLFNYFWTIYWGIAALIVLSLIIYPRVKTRYIEKPQ